MGKLIDLKNDIACSIFLRPCIEDELYKRDFLKSLSNYGIGRLIMGLESCGALYYKGDLMYIKKEWAKKHLVEYELDFRTEKQKELEGMTSFAKAVLKLT